MLSVFRGGVRATGDIDIWVKPEKENAQRLLKVFSLFGFGNLGLSLHDFISPDQVIQLGYEPIRIDILTSVSGLDFESAYEARIEAELEQTKMP